MIAIFKREIGAYFHSSIGYVFIAVVTFFASQFFIGVLSVQSPVITDVFSSMFAIVLTVIPILTMRLLSEEKKNKTDQLLLTSPVSMTAIVLGKYFAALLVYFISISVFFVFGAVYFFLNALNIAVFLNSFLGLFLLGAALISIGLLISSLTENQIIAAIGSFSIMLIIFLMDSIAKIVPIDFIKGMSFTARFMDFNIGLFNLSNVIFFISIAAICNFITVMLLDRR